MTSSTRMRLSPGAVDAIRVRSSRMMPIAASPTLSAPRGTPHKRQPSPSSNARPSAISANLAGQLIVAAHELGGELRLRAVVHILRRALLFDPAEVEQQDLVRHRHRLGLVVRHRPARRAQAHDQLAQPGARFLAQLRVEVGQRLVHQHHRRVVDQRARDRDALLLRRPKAGAAAVCASAPRPRLVSAS